MICSSDMAQMGIRPSSFKPISKHSHASLGSLQLETPDRRQRRQIEVSQMTTTSRAYSRWMALHRPYSVSDQTVFQNTASWPAHNFDHANNSSRNLAAEACCNPYTLEPLTSYGVHTESIATSATPLQPHLSLPMWRCLLNQ